MSRVVMLRIPNGSEADLFIRDMADNPSAPLLTPVQENAVHAELIWVSPKDEVNNVPL